jgi:predicted DNA-binding transcriptional regulator AlpA
VSSSTVEHFADHAAARRAETEAIRTERPLHNIVGSVRDRRPSRPYVSDQPDRSDQIVRLGDLLDARQVATLLGLSRSTGVAVYRSARKADGSLRHPDFPQPVLPCDGPVAGASYYWLLQDVVTFLAANPGLARKARDAGTPPS